MATVKLSDSKDMYSWWWNSHISPKNSKWLRENLTGMDIKVKQMIKLIEEDADSFARRAEMYYKKRPELMKLVEEFYRAYRALAERYDHATGVLRQAHQTMAEAFPNQVPMAFADDIPGGSAAEVIFSEESESSILRKGPRQFNDLFGSEEAQDPVKFAEGRASEGLNFNNIEEKEQSPQNNGDSDHRERTSKAEKEIFTLKNTLARLEAEKEAGLLEYQQSLERLSALEREFSNAQENSRGLNERASKAEAEVQTLKDALAKLGAEREANLVQYQICLEKINNLENSLSHALNEAAELNKRASEAEVKAQSLIQVEAEKEDSIARYKQCSETISNLEEKLSNAEKCARRMSERAEKAESELETLKQVVVELTKDKEAAALRYRQCLETISSLEMKLACAQEDIETCNQGLEDELRRVKEENKGLNELKLSSAMSIKNLQDEILSLRETVEKLDAGVDQRNALQQEICSLKEEVNEFSKRHQDMTGQLESVRLNPENFASSVKALQEENTKLKDFCKRDSDEKQAILQKLKLMEQLNEKNALLENSLSDLSIELEGVRGRVKTLEESRQSLLKEISILLVEKDALISQLQIATQNLEKLSEKNNPMENSLLDSNAELKEMREKLTSLEHSCMLLGDEKSVLITQGKIETELLELNEEIEEKKRREESLSVELEKGRNEVELWETQADAFFHEHQSSAVHEALLEQKVHETRNECEILESRSNSKAVRVEELEKSVRILEHENGLEDQMAAVHNPAIVSLLESMTSLESLTSLESQTLLHPKLSSGYSEEFKDTDLGTDLRAESCRQISEDQSASVSRGFSDLQGIHMRIKAIETALVEMERLAVLENINLNSKLETAMRQIKELRSGNSSRRESITAKGHVNARQEGRELSHGLGSIVEIQRPTTEISEEDNEMMTKDIMLDQISECTSYVISRKETDEVDNQMLEIGETVEHDGSANWKIGKAQNMVTATTDYEQIGTVKGHKSRNPSTESLVKELVVDKEGSERFTKPNQDGSKRKILERLGSDAHKLANLQITAQDLKRKVDITETGKRGEGIEYGTVKKKLEEAEDAIMKLGDANRQLMTQVEDGSWYPDGKSALEYDESASVREQELSEQAQRGSEKIGSLQLELQKIQFLILQLDDGKDSTGRTSVAEHKTRVQLRDYIYGGRNIPKKKKAHFCACVKPSTKGD